MFAKDLKSKSPRSSAGMSRSSKRSKSTGHLKNSNLKLPELIISSEPKTKLLNWNEILQNPFKLRDTPTPNLLSNCMFTKHASQIEDSVMIFQ